MCVFLPLSHDSLLAEVSAGFVDLSGTLDDLHNTCDRDGAQQRISDWIFPAISQSYESQG